MVGMVLVLIVRVFIQEDMSIIIEEIVSQPVLPAVVEFLLLRIEIVEIAM